jgi:hypothetical protein
MKLNKEHRTDDPSVPGTSQRKDRTLLSFTSRANG